MGDGSAIADGWPVARALWRVRVADDLTGGRRRGWRGGSDGCGRPFAQRLPGGAGRTDGLAGDGVAIA